VAASRFVLGELPFGPPPLQFVSHEAAARGASPADAADAARAVRYAADRTELGRMTFAAGVLLAATLWAAGGALAGRLAFRHGWLLALIAAFGVAAAASAWGASNRRAAVNAAVEHVAFLLAAFLAVQFCADRRRLVLLASVLLAAGATLAVKAFWQRAVEIPARIADFDAHRTERLAEFGWQAASPQAALIENRLRDTSVTGFLSLANPFGSLLVVLGFAGAGLAAAKLRAAVAAARRGRPARRRGEIDPLAVAAAVACILTAAVAVALAMTRSRGAAVGAAFGAAVFAAVLLAGRRIARHWRKALVALAGAFVLAVAGVVAYGLARDRLPTRTMTFRWYYWTASAAVIRDRPLLGAGGGNFATAYVQHRRDEAEEEVQMPHNAIAHALAEYGLAGGGVLLAIVVYLLIGCARPSDRTPNATEPRRAAANASVKTTRHLAPAFVVLAAFAARALLSDARLSPAMLVLDAAVPAVVLAALLAAAVWRGAELDDGSCSLIRVALGCGAAGFFLNAMVAESPWIPAPAMAVYLAAGACLADDGRPGRSIGRGAWAGAAFALVLTGAIVAGVWLPVARKAASQEQMLARLRTGDLRGAFAAAVAAARADTLDPQPAADAARLAVMQARPGGPGSGRAAAEAEGWASRALARDPKHFARVLALAEIRHRFGTPGDAAGDRPRPNAALDLFARAVALNPKDVRLRVRLAEVLAEIARRPAASPARRRELAARCLEQLREGRRINDRLDANSVVRLRGDELRELGKLEAWATGRLAPATLPPTSPAQRTL